MGFQLVAAEGPDGGLDTLITLRYPGLRIDLRKSGRDHQEYFSNVRAVDTGFALTADLRLFATTAGDLSRLLGAPPSTFMFGDTTVLSFEAPAGPVIQFYLLRDLLVLVRWVYELG